MTICIDNEQDVINELDNVLQELEIIEVSEAIRRACRVDMSDLINEEDI